MIRFITPIILIGLAIAGFFMFTNPLYNDISQLRTQVASYNEALNNSKALENERDKLTAKYNSINPEYLVKLTKLLPENIDNIRLILEIEKIASPYGMILRDVKYNTTNKVVANVPASGIAGISQAGISQSAQKDYGVWDLEFSTSGTYNNFMNFMKDLEKNLRIVDVSSIDFSSSVGLAGGTSPDSYKYSFKIKTYWLKN